MFSIITEYTNTKIQYLYPLLFKKKKMKFYTQMFPLSYLFGKNGLPSSTQAEQIDLLRRRFRDL